MADHPSHARTREAIDGALAELEQVLEGRKPASAELLARALHASLLGQRQLLEQLGRAPGGAPLPGDEPYEDPDDEPDTAIDHAAGPIPPEALTDDDDEPTIFLEDAEPAPAEQKEDDGSASREALRRFAPEDINRWLKSGTPFQMRGDLAYLNIDAMGRLSTDLRAKLRELGFVNELGTLDDPAVAGRVELFQKES